MRCKHASGFPVRKWPSERLVWPKQPQGVCWVRGGSMHAGDSCTHLRVVLNLANGGLCSEASHGVQGWQ